MLSLYSSPGSLQIAARITPGSVAISTCRKIKSICIKFQSLACSELTHVFDAMNFVQIRLWLCFPYIETGFETERCILYSFG